MSYWFIWVFWARGTQEARTHNKRYQRYYERFADWDIDKDLVAKDEEKHVLERVTLYSPSKKLKRKRPGKALP